MNKRMLVGMLLVFLISLDLCQCRQIQVSPITNAKEIDIKLGALGLLSLPGQPLQKVYSKGVKQLLQNKSTFFEPCKQNGPQVQIKLQDNVLFTGVPKKPEVIYTFEDIRYSQFLLDIYYENNEIYLMFQNGMMVYIELKSDKKMKNFSVNSIEGITENFRLEVGQFIKVSNQIIFVNSAYAIKVTSSKASMLTGYQQEKGFESAISIGPNIFAVAYRTQGIKFFSIKDQSIVLAKHLTPQSFLIERALSILDMDFYVSQSLLLIVDEDNGIIKFDIKIEGQQISVTQFGFILQHHYCDLIHFHQQAKTAYISCKYIYEVSFAEYPFVSTKTLPHPNIKVRQIYTVGSLVAFVGRDVFKLLYLDRLVSYFQDIKLDKILFTENIFISANEGGLFIGDYSIQQPYITCITSNKDYLGSHKLQLAVEAECNQKFLAANGISSKTIGDYSPQDKCLYTIYQTVYFWESGQIFLLPLIIGLSVFIFISLTVIIIWIVKKARISFMQRKLDQYSKIGASGAHVDYQKYEDQKGTEQLEMPQNKQSDKDVNKSNLSNKNEQDVQQHNTANYDIE